MNNKAYTSVLYFWLLFAPVVIIGQNDPPLRIEIETKTDGAKYNVVTCGENGVILFYETTVLQDNYKFWVFNSYNKFMQEAWKKDVPVYQNMVFRQSKFTGGHLYLFFHDIEKKKKEDYNYQVLKINSQSGRYELFSGNLPENTKLIDFNVIGNHLVAGFDMSEEAVLIFSLNLMTKDSKYVYELKEFTSKFKNIYLDTLNNSYVGVINVFVSKTENYLLLKEFDLTDNNINSIIIKPGENKKLNSGKLISISRNERMVIGTYDYVKSSSIDKKNYFKNASTGFYSVKILNNSQQESHYYNFLELENMTGYLKSKEYQQALKKSSKSEERSDKYSPQFDLLIHDIVQKDSLLFFVGEAFYEEFHTVTNTYYDYYGRPMPVTIDVFDGYRYFNAFVSCFDRNGIKLWDNGMEIFKILTFELINRINLYFNGDEIVMAYNRDGKIGAKIIKGPSVVEGVEYFPLDTTFDQDKIIADTKSSMEHWYDNYFLAYGFQTLKNNSRSGSDKRVVFYMNKVSFQ